MKTKKSIVVMIIVVLGYFLCPRLISSIFRLNTSKVEIINKRKIYNETSIKINSKDLSNYKNDSITLNKLYIWFNIRNLNIDEDHLIKSTYERWEEIIQYSNMSFK